MINGEIELSSKDILSKEFKIDTRGYRPQEVDRFLDIIIKDYETYNRLLKEAANDKQELIDENIALKQDIRNLRAKIELLATSSTDSSNSTADVLRRLSNLEKIVYENDKWWHLGKRCIFKCRGKSMLTLSVMVVMFVHREKLTYGSLWLTASR